MKKPYFISIAILALGGFFSLSLAFSSRPAVKVTPSADKVEKKQEETHYFKAEANTVCPSIEALQKKKMRWYGPLGWKASDDSFVDEIAYFMGAQWIGINVGQVVCFYKGEHEYTFPVTLERDDVLVPKPSGGKWGKDLGGYMHCSSKNTGSCAFYVEPPGEKNKKDIYEQLKGFKSS